MATKILSAKPNGKIRRTTAKVVNHETRIKQILKELGQDYTWYKIKRELKYLGGALLIASICLVGEGCKSTGYGCKGKSKYITGHRPNGY
jgi:hypothetical protein